MKHVEHEGHRENRGHREKAEHKPMKGQGTDA